MDVLRFALDAQPDSPRPLKPWTMSHNELRYWYSWIVQRQRVTTWIDPGTYHATWYLAVAVRVSTSHSWLSFQRPDPRNRIICSTIAWRPRTRLSGSSGCSSLVRRSALRQSFKIPFVALSHATFFMHQQLHHQASTFC